MFAVYQIELLEVFDAFHPSLFHFRKIILIVQTLQNLFMTSFGGSIFLIKIIENITYTDSVTAYLICISRTDSLSGSTHFRIPFGGFVSSIQNTVCRQDKMCFFRNMQPVFQVMPRCFQSFGFRFE